MEHYIFGLDESELIEFENFKIHREVLPQLLKLKTEALKAGFDLQVTSCYRGFETQKKIWNNKAKGLRTLLDDQGRPLNFSELSPVEIMWSILRWSALPGASRHHWGTDLDVYDLKALPTKNYQVELTPQEVEGIFKPLHDWLSDRINQGSSFNFYRPYQDDLGGVAPEMWHLSYWPIAEKNLHALSLKKLKDFIEKQKELELKALVLDHLDEIYEQYVLNISPPPLAQV
jgi:LAS superfamily LD-carboxypeptidase LdcB